MIVVKKQPTVGDTVVIGHPHIKPKYLNGATCEVEKVSYNGMELTLRLTAFQGNHPSNSRFYVGGQLRCPLHLLAGVVEQHEAVAA